MSKKKNNDLSEVIARAISEWFTTYLPDVRNASSHTIKAYHDALELFVTFLEEEKHITPDSLFEKSFSVAIVQEWVKWLKEKRNCVNSTCNHRITALRSFVSFVRQKDIVFLNTELELKGLRPLKFPKQTQIEFSQGALESFFKAIDVRTITGKRDYTLLFLMYCIGARVDEILSIKMRDLHIDLPEKERYVSLMGKGTKPRTPPILKEVAVILESYIKNLSDTSSNALLFPSTHGDNKKLTNEAVNKRMKFYAKEAHAKDARVPLDLHCHVLRHARATHWLEEGLSLPAIQRLMGHEDIRTTMRYVYISPEQKAQALASMEDETTKKLSKNGKKAKKIRI